MKCQALFSQKNKTKIGMSSVSIVTGMLTLPSLQTTMDTFAKSVDPDETACNELSHQD